MPRARRDLCVYSGEHCGFLLRFLMRYRLQPPHAAARQPRCRRQPANPLDKNKSPTGQVMSEWGFVALRLTGNHWRSARDGVRDCYQAILVSLETGAILENCQADSPSKVEPRRLRKYRWGASSASTHALPRKKLPRSACAGPLTILLSPRRVRRRSGRPSSCRTAAPRRSAR